MEVDINASHQESTEVLQSRKNDCIRKKQFYILAVPSAAILDLKHQYPVGSNLTSHKKAKEEP